jgi:maleate isomerase
MSTGSSAAKRAAVAPDPRERPIEIVPVPLGRAPGHLARIGLIGLSSGMTCEEELHRMLPEGTMVLTSRVSNQNRIDLASLSDIERDMVRAASTLLPEGHLDVVVYSCTSGTVAMGEQKVFDRIREARPGVAVTTPFTGAVAALTRLDLHRIVLVTPYTEELTRAVRGELEKRGLDVVRTVALGLGLDSEMSRVEPETLRDLAIDVDTPAAEGMFISCTALRTSPIIEQVEQAIGKPVVTSNQAIVWHALRLAGYASPVPGLGRLLHLPLDR